MTALSNSLLISKGPSLHLSSDQSGCSTKLFFSVRRGVKRSSFGRSLSVQARYSDRGRPNNGGFFIGGFVLGGLVVGSLGCVYAPQEFCKYYLQDVKVKFQKDMNVRAPAPSNNKDLKLLIQKQRKILAKKIEQINYSIDDISAQLRSVDIEDGAAVNPDEAKTLV